MVTIFDCLATEGQALNAGALERAAARARENPGGAAGPPHALRPTTSDTRRLGHVNGLGRNRARAVPARGADASLDEVDPCSWRFCALSVC